MVLITDTYPAQRFWRSDELTAMATHIVVGKIEGVFERRISNGIRVETHHVAEVRVTDVQKGENITAGELVYVHYWTRAITISAKLVPYDIGQREHPQPDDQVRVFLIHGNDNRFDVIEPNGFEKLKDDIETGG